MGALQVVSLGRSLIAVAGCTWILQGFLSATSSGLFSTSSTLDLSRLAFAGTLDPLLPVWMAGVILLLPAVGVALVAFAPWANPWAQVARRVAGAVGVVAALLQVAVVSGLDAGRLGPGALCCAAGLALVVAGLGLDRSRPTNLAGERPGVANVRIPTRTR